MFVVLGKALDKSKREAGWMMMSVYYPLSLLQRAIKSFYDGSKAICKLGNE